MNNKRIQEWVQTVREFEEGLTNEGLKYLGWANGWKTGDEPAEYKAHYAEKCPAGGSKSFSQRGTHETCWCDLHKVWWNVDMGD